MGTKNIFGVKPWIINKKNCNMLPIIKSPTDESAVDGFCQSTDIVNVGGLISYLICILKMQTVINLLLIMLWFFMFPWLQSWVTLLPRGWITKQTSKTLTQKNIKKKRTETFKKWHLGKYTFFKALHLQIYAMYCFSIILLHIKSTKMIKEKADSNNKKTLIQSH